MDVIAAHHLGQHFLLGPEGDLAAGLEHQQLVERGHGAWPVRDDDGDAAVGADPGDRVGEGRLAFGIEVGVGLVENEEEGVAEQRAGEADALALAGREAIALAPTWDS